VLDGFPTLPALAVGGSYLGDLYPKKEIPQAYVPRTSLGQEGALGLCQTLVLLQSLAGKEEVRGVVVG
jgi:hypothetical protein